MSKSNAKQAKGSTGFSREELLARVRKASADGKTVSVSKVIEELTAAKPKSKASVKVPTGTLSTAEQQALDALLKKAGLTVNSEGGDATVVSGEDAEDKRLRPASQYQIRKIFLLLEAQGWPLTKTDERFQAFYAPMGIEVVDWVASLNVVQASMVISELTRLAPKS